MKKIQENILFLNWTLPIISFFFLLITVKFSALYHSQLLIKIFLLCLGFSAIVSFVYRKSLVIGEALFIGILSIIFFGSLPSYFQLMYGLIVISLFFFEIKFLFQILNKRKLLILFYSFVAVLLTFIPYFTFEYSQPNSMYKLMNSGLHNDTLYHVAMASMWKVHHAISHGLHGLGALEYHYGSHLLMAGASSLLQISSFESYSHFFGFFCIPLLSISCISVSEEFMPSYTNKEFIKKVSFYSFIMLGTGVLKLGGFWGRFALAPSFYESESYAISLVLLFTFLSILKTKNIYSVKIQNIYIISALGLLIVTKISTGFFALGLLGSWALLSGERKLSKEWLNRWVIFFTSLILFLVLFISNNPSKGDAFFQPLHFVHTYVDFKSNICIKYILFVFFHFFFVILAVIIYASYYRQNLMHRTFPLWWMLGTLISFFVGLGVVTLLHIVGGSAYYVSNVSMFMAVPFLVCIPQFLKNKLNKAVRLFLIIILFAISLYNAPRLLFDGAKNFVIQIKQSPSPNAFSVYIDKLNIIRKDPNSKKALVYIPRRENSYWKEPQPNEKVDPTCRSAGYIIPAISERPAIYGWPSNECYSFLCSARFHSEGLCDKSKENFTDSELLTEAKKLGFEQVDIITEAEIRILR